MRNISNNKGITLIALVITIIVLLILTGITLSAVIGENGLISKSQRASLAHQYGAYKEALELSLNEGVTCSGSTMKTYISSLSDEDLDKFVILNGKLVYIGANELEKEVAESLNMDTSLSGDSSITDIQKMADKILPITTTITLPENDNMPTPSGLIGTRLYDKNAENGERWNIVIDYNESNQEIGRYGSKYYLVKAGNYTVNGETVTISEDYIINYETQSIVGLSNNYVDWSLDSTLAVSEGLVLNIDPTNLANGEWTGITKHGDVEYDATTKALKFNEDEVNNPNGEGGYLELTRSGVDFTDGFTFEIYANLSRLRYNNGIATQPCSGLFCRMPTLESNFMKALRFGYATTPTICKFYSSSSWNGTGSVISTNGGGDVYSEDCGYDVGENFYLTFVYTAYDSTKSAEYQAIHYDEKMINEGIDKVEYYVNGELFGYTYYGHDSYQFGLETWNMDECPFFLGVSPWYGNGCLYYLKGSVYTCRLYTCSMTADEVSANRDMTERYRESF